MKTAFGHRGESLFPRDPSWKVPEDRAEDLVEDRVEDLAEDRSEVKLEEYITAEAVVVGTREPPRVRTDLLQEIGLRPPMGRKEAEE
jgi:hypothetical protein